MDDTTRTRIDNCKPTHKDTMKYRDRIHNLPISEWKKYNKLCREYKETSFYNRATEFVFIVKCMMLGIKP